MARRVPKWAAAPTDRVKRGAPERSVQISIVRYLETVLPRGSLVMAIRNEHKAESADPMARARFYQARKAEGTKTGAPDIVCALPEGRTFWIECKAPKTGVISEAQQIIHNQLRTLQHFIVVADSIESVRYGLNAAGVHLREADGQLAVEAKVRKARVKALVSDPIPF